MSPKNMGGDSSILATLIERLENVQEVQKNIFADQKELRKHVFGNGNKGLGDLIDENSRQIREIIKWKEESDKAKKDRIVENSKYLWGMGIVSLTAVLTTIGNIAVALLNSK